MHRQPRPPLSSAFPRDAGLDWVWADRLITAEALPRSGAMLPSPMCAQVGPPAPSITCGLLLLLLELETGKRHNGACLLVFGVPLSCYNGDIRFEPEAGRVCGWRTIATAVSRSTLSPPLAIKRGQLVDREKFEDLVAQALSELPEEFREKLENVDVVVADYPTRRQMTNVRRGMTLLGLYEGVPQTRRTRGYNLVPPDRITIFQKPVEAECTSESEIAEEIQRVVLHEIAHHFGLSDAQLREIEAGRHRRRRR